jgi:hypothetical protein
MAVLLNADSQYLYRAANLPSGDCTVAGWFYQTADTNNYAIPIHLDVVSIESDSDGTTYGVYSGGLWTFGSQPGLNAPTFFALKRSGSTATGYWRSPTSAFVTVSASMSGSYGHIGIGQYQPSPNYGFRGRVWNVKCWDRALSADELLIESMYRRVMFPSSINFHWPLDNHNDTKVYSGNGRDATVAGTLATAEGPYGLWRPRRHIFIPAAAGGAAYSIAAEYGSYTLTGQAAAARAARQLAAAQGSYSLSGAAAGLPRGLRVAAEQGSYALTGQDAAVRAARVMLAAQGSYSINGQSATLRAARQLAAEQGTYDLTGQAAGLQYGRKVTAEPGAYALTGQDAAVQSARVMLAAQGSYSINGQDAALGYDAAEKILAATSGIYTLDGQTANLRAARRALAEAGAYVVTGQDAAPTRLARLPLVTGAYEVAGQDVALLLDATDAELAAETGLYALTGEATNLRAARTALAESGSYILTGEATRLARAARLVLEGGAYDLSGQDIALLYDDAELVLAADAGTYALTGQPLNLRAARELVAESGAYALLGEAVRVARGARVVLGPGTYAISGQDAALRVAARVLLAAHGSYSLIGQPVVLRYSAVTPRIIAAFSSARLAVTARSSARFVIFAKSSI